MFDVYFNHWKFYSADICSIIGSINPDDMLTVLNDITVAGQSWENIGFDSEDYCQYNADAKEDDSILCVVEHGHS